MSLDDELVDDHAVAKSLRRHITGLTPEVGRLVRLLADDLQGGGDRLEKWADLDLVSTLARSGNIAPIPATPGGSAGSVVVAFLRRGLGERVIEAVLGVFIFLPLLATWIGLAMAANAYGRLVSSHPKTTTSFLQLWESGFDGSLPSWARFGDIAVIAVIFISMLLLLSAFHALARHRAQTAIDRQRADSTLRISQFAAVLARAQLVLNGHGRRLRSPAHFTSALGESADRLHQLITDATTVQEAAVRTLDRTEILAERLDEAATKVADSVGQAARSSAQAEGAVQSALDSLRQTQDAATSTVRDLLQEGASSLRDVQTAGIASAEEAAARTREVVREGVTALRDSQSAVVGAVDAARTAMVDSTTRSATEVSGVGDRVRDTVGAVGDQVSGAVDRVEAALRMLTSIQEELRSGSEEVVRSAGEMVGSMRRVAQETAGSVLHLGQVVEHWDAAAAHWVQAAEVVERGTEAAFRTRYAVRPAEAGAPGWSGPNGAKRSAARADSVTAVSSLTADGPAPQTAAGSGS
jgi:ABC-type transporter Mla subunit MlaD